MVPPVHCRKRKSRCLLSEGMQDKPCLNCRRRNEDCNFLTVDKVVPSYSHGNMSKTTAARRFDADLPRRVPVPSIDQQAGDRPQLHPRSYLPRRLRWEEMGLREQSSVSALDLPTGLEHPEHTFEETFSWAAQGAGPIGCYGGAELDLWSIPGGPYAAPDEFSNGSGVSHGTDSFQRPTPSPSSNDQHHPALDVICPLWPTWASAAHPWISDCQ